MPRTTTDIHAARRLRVERSAAALIAQYIHELSARHGSPVLAAAPGDDQAPESERG